MKLLDWLRGLILPDTSKRTVKKLEFLSRTSVIRRWGETDAELRERLHRAAEKQSLEAVRDADDYAEHLSRFGGP